MRPASSTTRRAASSIRASADLLSAPRIVPPALRTSPSSTTGSSVPVERNGVEVRAEEERDALLAASARNRQRMFPAVEPIVGPAAVLVPLEADRVELARDPVGHGPLLPGRARDRAELEEEVDDARRQLRLLHGAILRAARDGPAARASPRTASARDAVDTAARGEHRCPLPCPKQTCPNPPGPEVPGHRPPPHASSLVAKPVRMGHETVPNARRSFHRVTGGRACAGTGRAEAVRVPSALRRRPPSARVSLERGGDELAEERRRPRRARLELRVELARDEPRMVGSSTISTRRPCWNVPETTSPASTSCSR